MMLRPWSHLSFTLPDSVFDVPHCKWVFIQSDYWRHKFKQKDLEYIVLRGLFTELNNLIISPQQYKRTPFNKFQFYFHCILTTQLFFYRQPILFSLRHAFLSFSVKKIKKMSIFSNKATVKTAIMFDACVTGDFRSRLRCGKYRPGSIVHLYEIISKQTTN